MSIDETSADNLTTWKDVPSGQYRQQLSKQRSRRGIGEIIGRFLVEFLLLPSTACVPGKTRQPPVILVTALAAGSTGPRRRRCSLCVHLPRGKGGWPRP
ncbi:hypothetical protein ACS0PU_007688 [Formica fusca]